jgi:hypothetical protein
MWSGVNVQGGNTTGEVGGLPAVSMEPTDIARTITREKFERICKDRDSLTVQLDDAPSGSVLANDLTNKLSLVVAVIYECMDLHPDWLIPS